ncbi:hypothetical protein F0562_029054 [Nyssa sinensis]|uniref:Protein TIFY n=1 Tax=Nyssa sinensis TaxID=561372 RepID=A0A5J5B2V3_9ASTE|nr:hypothetical protein F0562_029054 [Nyssa sinensis]
MSCGFVIAKDLMKTETSHFNAQTSIARSSRTDVLASCLEQVDTPNDHQKALFRKYLFTKSQHNIGKTNAEESQAIRKAPPRPLIPPKCGGGFRPTSNLERVLLPEIKNDAVFQTSSGDKGSTAQLTIFYSGNINVYDNVPIDKAQAIMLLAGGSSFAAPVVTKLPDNDLKKPLQRSNLPSVCKLQAELPIARKHSLQCFLKKRRDRIINKSPYAPSTSRVHEDDDNNTTDDGSNEKGSFFPSPFPSRLGYFFPLPANKDC